MSHGYINANTSPDPTWAYSSSNFWELVFLVHFWWGLLLIFEALVWPKLDNMVLMRGYDFFFSYGMYNIQL
jgi:hypothetical protein